MALNRRIPGQAMEHSLWQRRARAAGLTQKALAKLLGHTEQTVSHQLRERRGGHVARHIRAAIVAWELMTEETRAKWLAEVDRSDETEDAGPQP